MGRANDRSRPFYGRNAVLAGAGRTKARQIQRHDMIGAIRIHVRLYREWLILRTATACADAVPFLFHLRRMRQLSCHPRPALSALGDVFSSCPFQHRPPMSLLTMMFRPGYRPSTGDFVHSSRRCHLYSNHLDQARLAIDAPDSSSAGEKRSRCEGHLAFRLRRLCARGETRIRTSRPRSRCERSMTLNIRRARLG